jgi:hypothetical protein
MLWSHTKTHILEKAESEFPIEIQKILHGKAQKTYFNSLTCLA